MIIVNGAEAALGASEDATSPSIMPVNVANAIVTGKRAAEVARAAGIESVVFDRGAAKYHGKVKALADAAREAGLKF